MQGVWGHGPQQEDHTPGKGAGGNMVKIVDWYDNECGYSCRTSDLAKFLVDKGL